MKKIFSKALLLCNFKFRLTQNLLLLLLLLFITNSIMAQNLARNKAVYASSVQSAGFEEAKVNDGDYSTFWSSSYNDDEWIYIDLQGYYKLREIKIHWEGAYAKRYTVEISSDNSNYQSVFTEENGDGGIDSINLNGITGRYLKINCLERGTAYGNAINEIEIYPIAQGEQQYADGTATDQDLNTFKWISLGNQDWATENAEVVAYRDGTPIPQVTDFTEWKNLTTGAWCYVSNNQIYTKLYNWYAVMGIHDNDENTPNKEFAPEGWRVPTDDEWTELEHYLIENGYNYDDTNTGNKIAKSMASATGWYSSTENGAVGNESSYNNKTGFDASPNGYRQVEGWFDYTNRGAIFWSSTAHDSNKAKQRGLFWNNNSLVNYESSFGRGLSVRFISDTDSNINKNYVDFEPPVISILGCNPDSVISGTFYNDPGATAIDNYDGDITHKIEKQTSWAPGGKQYETYTVSDDAGNSSSVKRTIFVQAASEWKNIGTQDWATENAEVVAYRDGTPIPQVTDFTEWENLTTGAWGYYDNDQTKGKIYNWYAVMGIHDNDENTPNKEFAPEGWRVPTDDEWSTLVRYLSDNGLTVKSIASTRGWKNSNEEGAVGNSQCLNNSSGFNAFPIGYNNVVGLTNEGVVAQFWTSTIYGVSAIKYLLYYNSTEITRSWNFHRRYSSVRFLRDTTTASTKDYSNSITIYPNPTSSIINIEHDFTTAKVYDFSGRELFKSKSKTIDLSELPSNIYLLRLFDNSNKVLGISKIIKE